MRGAAVRGIDEVACARGGLVWALESPSMDWAAPLSAIAGALAGIVATYVVDRGRWKQTREAESNQILRETFVAYLAHLARAVENMRHAAEAAYDTPEERRRAIRGAFSETGLFEQRYGLTMLAPPVVVEVGVDAFRRVRELRDLLADGANVTDHRFRTAQHRYFEAVVATSEAMREELRIPRLGFTPLGDEATGISAGGV